ALGEPVHERHAEVPLDRSEVGGEVVEAPAADLHEAGLFARHTAEVGHVLEDVLGDDDVEGAGVEGGTPIRLDLPESLGRVPTSLREEGPAVLQRLPRDLDTERLITHLPQACDG